MKLKKVKIGANEKTGMNTFYEVSLNKNTYKEEGVVYNVGIAINRDGYYVTDMTAIKNGYFGYMKKTDAEKLYKEVVATIKRTGNADLYKQHGATIIKG